MKTWWIHKGDSNFCSKLVLGDDYESMVKQKPDGFYDIVSTADTIEGGVKVIAHSDHLTIVAGLEHQCDRLAAALAFYRDRTLVLSAEPIVGKERQENFADELARGYLNEYYEFKKARQALADDEK